MPREITFDLFIRRAGLVLLTIGILLLVNYLSGVLLPFCIAWLFAYLLYPIVKFVQYRLGVRVRALAILITMVLVLAVVGGLFVAETLSVIMQVGYFRWTGGKRLFRMAPLHHHFELKGVPESKIIIRFWITSILLGLMALSVLELR